MQICNLSIKLSMVPDESKMAKLKPLYKKDKKTEGGRGGGGATMTISDFLK